MNPILKDILETFSALWRFRTRGESIEIITPYVTTNNMFVTLFLTQRGDEYIITDGGAIDRGAYECMLPFEEECFEKVFRFYLCEYGVATTIAKGYNYYFKKTDNPALIPNILFDMANFISSVVSASFIQFQTDKERQMIQTFRQAATEFIKGIFPDKVKTNSYISESLSAIKFNAIIHKRGRYSLVNYVTGSTNAYFISSLAKSNLNFDIVENSDVERFVSKKIILIDNNVRSYNSAKIAPYLNLLNGRKNRHIIPWTQRQTIEEFI